MGMIGFHKWLLLWGSKHKKMNRKMYEHSASCEFVFLKEMFLLNYVVRKEALLGIVVYFCAVTRVRSFLVLNIE